MHRTQTAARGNGRMRGIAAILLALVAASAWLLVHAAPGHAAACAAEVEYVGPEGGEWGNKANWTGGKLPTETQTVCIPENKGTITVAKGSTALSLKLVAMSPVLIEAEATLKIAAGEGSVDHSSFVGLTVSKGGTLAMTRSRVALLGDTVLDGEVTGKSEAGDELVLETETGTLSGTGKTQANLAGLKGHIAPGGKGTIGALTFLGALSLVEQVTVEIDLAGDASFDQLIKKAGESTINAKVEGKLLGGYSPALNKTWLYLGGGAFCVSCGVGTKGFQTESAAGGALLKITEVPPVLPQPPTLEATPENTQGRFKISPPVDHGTGALTEYELTVEPGSHHIGNLLYTSPSPIEITLTSLTNCITYTATAIDKTTVGPSAPSAAVKFTPTGPEGCGGTKPTEKGGEKPAPVEEHLATTPKAVEELALGCSGKQLVLNDVYIHGSRVAIAGSAARALVGKKVQILFNEKKVVATASVAANGQFTTTAPLPPKKIREALTTRYSAAIGKLRSLHLKLTRRLLLEPPRASGSTVTLTGIVTPPLTKPVAPVIVEQQLECGRTTIAQRFTPPANGHFHITLTLPAGAKAAIYRLTSSVAANPHATAHGFRTFSLPLPLTTG